MAKYDVKENLFMYVPTYLHTCITYGSYKRATNQWALIFISLSAFGNSNDDEDSKEHSQPASHSIST